MSCFTLYTATAPRNGDGDGDGVTPLAVKKIKGVTPVIPHAAVES